MPRCCDRGAADNMVTHCLKPLTVHKFWDVPEVDSELVDFWVKLDLKSRQALLTVDKKALFQRIRSQYCSRCFGLFVMRYDELKCSAQLDCPSEFHALASTIVGSTVQLAVLFRALVCSACSLSGVLCGAGVLGLRLSNSGRAYSTGKPFCNFHGI